MLGNFYSACVNHRYGSVRRTIKLNQFNLSNKPHILNHLILLNVHINIIHYWFEINPTDDQLITIDLLKTAYECTTLDIFSLLVSRVILLNEQNQRGETILYGCAHSFRCYPERIKLLLDRGANPNLGCYRTYRYGDLHTPLGELIQKHCLNLDRIEAIKLLLDYGANPNHITGPGNKKPLDLLILYSGPIQLMYLLMQYGATDVNKHNEVYIKRVLLICDMMLYTDGIPSDWIIGIKEYMY
jgi:ankyrin repeat protein